MNQQLPSFNYRAMIYFAHSTLVIYSKSIESWEGMSVEEFKEKNQDVTQRVFDEGISIFNYELSSEQMSRACYVYLKAKYWPDSVKEISTYQLG